MVEIYQANALDHVLYGGGNPLIHIHSIRREVFGNEISLWVAGEIRIAAKEVVFAKELKLNSIEVLVLTPEAANHVPYIVNKWIYRKGLYDNYASIDIFAPTAGFRHHTVRSQQEDLKMFNPLKMNPIEKRMLLGGLATSMIYYGNHYAMDTVAGYPPELKNRVDPHMPQNADILTSLAPPATLYVAKKIVKTAGKKEKIGDMALGATLYGVPNFLHDVVVQTAYVEGVAARPAARFPTMPVVASKYIANNNNLRVPQQASSVSKYVITS